MKKVSPAALFAFLVILLLCDWLVYRSFTQLRQLKDSLAVKVEKLRRASLQVDSLKLELEDLKKKIKEFEKNLPSEVAISYYFSTLQRNASSSQLRLTGASVSPARARKDSLVRQLSISLNFYTSSYSNFSSFLEKVSSLDRIFSVSSLSMRWNDRLSAIESHVEFKTFLRREAP